jgi:hypothetical protein
MSQIRMTRCPSDNIFKMIANGATELSMIEDVDIDAVSAHIRSCPKCAEKAQIMAQTKRYSMPLSVAA